MLPRAVRFGRVAQSKRTERALDGTPRDVLLIHFRDEATARAFAAASELPVAPSS
jgi:hypothetical protein